MREHVNSKDQMTRNAFLRHFSAAKPITGVPGFSTLCRRYKKVL